jgi:hypothetical protein
MEGEFELEGEFEDDSEDGLNGENGPGVVDEDNVFLPGGEAAQYAGPSDPVPVEETDQVYTDFKSNFGEDQAALLASVWKDEAVLNDHVVNTFVDDHPQLDTLISQHEGDGTGLSLEGVAAVGKYLQSAGFNMAELGDLDHILMDNLDEATNTITAAGVWIALNYIGQRSGYKAIYRNPRK